MTITMGGGATASAIKVVFLLFLSLNLQAIDADADMVDEWCKRTSFMDGANDLCVSIIDADPRSQLKNTPQGLCSILRDRAVVEVSAAKKMVKHILHINKRNNTFNHYAVKCLQFSTRQYDGMIYDLQIADFKFSDINVTSFRDGLEQMSRTYYGARECEYCFTEWPETTPSPMTAQNQKIKDICNHYFHFKLSVLQECTNLPAVIKRDI